MSPSPRLSPYPWSAVERLSRASLEAERVLSERVRLREVATCLCAKLASWSGQRASFDCRRILASEGEPREPIPRLLFRGVAEPVSLLACIDPRLCLRIGQRLAGGKEVPVDPLAPVDPALMGAVAALASHLIEQSGFAEPLRIGWGRLGQGQGPRFTVEGTLHWGQAAYELVLEFDVPWSPTRAPQPPANVAVLGELPLTLCLVSGVCSLSTRELRGLHVGALLLPDEAGFLDGAANGRGYLTTKGSPWAYPVTLVEGRQIVLGPRAVNRDLDELVAAAGSTPEGEQGLSCVLGDAQLTAHIELGSVTLTAAQLARLRPGDTLETPQGLGERARLRVAGRVVAKGELVSIDGHVGLRILELVTGESQ